MQAVSTFIHFTERPATMTDEWISGAYRALCERADSASDDAQWVGLCKDWNSLKAYVEGEDSRRSFRFRQDMNDSALEEQDRIMREEIIPAAETGDALLGKALLASDHRDAVAKHFGNQLLDVLSIKEGPLAPINSDLRIQVS
ncbi:MAG: M3 family oligoendopeptidase, partial [Alphaproteobacteria bacterium]|nr:M3 family oligoendopeptidase [Alphaproteobacteria bacterium]